MSEIIRWSAAETVGHLKARDVSAEEVCAAHLARIDAVNPSLNAVVDAVPAALARARDIDAGRIPAGILFGAPVTTKINADQAGLASTHGLQSLARNIAAADSAVVRNLKGTGAVIVGRTNTPEMSLRWCTSNPLHGVSLNPWDANTTPGGSSGAAAAAVAAGIGVIAHGNDLGGSVRYPAYCCGVVGLRPSQGRVPAWNPTAPAIRPPMLSLMAVQGPIARSVADVKLGLAAMRGFAAEDPNWTAAPNSGRSGTGRIAIAQDFFAGETHPEVTRAMAKATEAAQEAGMEVCPVPLPDPERIAELWGQLLFTEVAEMNAAQIKADGSADLRRWVAAFLDHFGTLDLAGYMRGIAERSVHQMAWRELFQRVDGVILPTSLIPPFENDLDFNAPDEAAGIIAAQKPLYILNLLGLPSVALPTHVAGGLPLGVQIAGPMHDDDALLDIAERIEHELGGVLDQIPAHFTR